jgi:FKBP-type peptidyl-prolyl cis-trans isomerase (trigger factor)
MPEPTSAIALERLVVEVEDAAVDEALSNLADSAKDYETSQGRAPAETATRW